VYYNNINNNKLKKQQIVLLFKTIQKIQNKGDFKMSNLTKKQLCEKLQQLNIECSMKMKIDELRKLYENSQNSQKSTNSIAIVSNNETIQTIQNNETNDDNFENTQTNENVNEMLQNYIEFLNENELIHKIQNNVINVNCVKKQIFVKIDCEKNYAHVFTILNKKLSNDMNENKKYARNILTLKSLRALKSYTMSNAK
jgi:hypothetical protein